MHQAVLRINSNTPYERATAGSDARIELWCNNHCDLLSVDGRVGEEVFDHIEETVGVYNELRGEHGRVIVTDACLKAHSKHNIEPYLESNNCLLVPPIRYEGGAKRVRVLASRAEDLTNFYAEITETYEVHVESKREITAVFADQPVVSLQALLPTLSPRQREIFTLAHERGYYEIPRETTTTELAEEVGIQRRTLEHHLRRTEEKLADAFVELL
ncbi:DNA binding protein [Halogeometricum borinquense DSM 11551]|uniref:DNA binding protein n=1 Tax=Halogeometricum borinquense (strain ATCC 700274 / DSM 11551 / JCM 10706 / KCTC 4070 / PR3) TaxID=469382 RepID=E4NKR5_HALBP|nr:helix-turn-helix domain-containing protein [Halogeometricum borinquense]ADQ65961.1 predicted DNA binding protein [Halogeometricum borinquense DSM 11551]ELY23117.1 DNA binding protein [Halogeometricum borinquense DSM 11551]